MKRGTILTSNYVFDVRGSPPCPSASISDMFAHTFRIQCCASGGRRLDVLPVLPVDSAVSLGAVNHVSRCVKCKEYTHVATEFPPSSWTSGTLRKLGLQKVFPFRMPEKRFPENRRKSWAHAYALTLRRLRAIDSTTEITAFPYYSQSPPSSSYSLRPAFSPPPRLKALPCLARSYVRINHQRTMTDHPGVFTPSPPSENHAASMER
jgi:hypothetical protein